MVSVSDKQLARHLGLRELCVGASRVDAIGVGCPRVLAWWAVSVNPSFVRSWTVGAVHEESWVSGPDPDWVTARGFVADTDEAAVAALEADPVLDALAALNPFRVEPTCRRYMAHSDEWCQMATLDGLGYSLRWETRAVQSGSLAFANPRTGWLRQLEGVLFSFARQVVSASSTSRFEAQLGCWFEYREPVDPAE